MSSQRVQVDWYLQPRQPGSYCVSEPSEWVAGGWSLTFVLAQRESHWSLATQTCPLPPLPSLVPINTPLPEDGFRFQVANPGRKSRWKIQVENPGGKSRRKIQVEHPGGKSRSQIQVANPGRKSGSQIQRCKTQNFCKIHTDRAEN